MLNAVVVPDSVDEAAVRSSLRADFKIEIGAGLGPLAGQIWGVGLMGNTARPDRLSKSWTPYVGCWIDRHQP